ncbi:MAG: SpoIVB peptidase [Bacilli bacterium]|nr:SpoIVB peptidase [Bacilli bacterium]
MKIKKIFLMLLITLISIPTNIYAYSNKIILGGNNIGIEVKTKGILVVGLYEIDNERVAESSGIQAGDYIISVNNNNINSISDFTKEIENDDDKKSINITYKRKNKTFNTTLNIVEKDGEYKTGLYVKDKINGIGTLTFIDPQTKKFGALGHEIVTKETNEILNIDDGSIYYSYITGITKSNNGNPGEKEADYDNNKKYGIIKENTNKGIFGDYTDSINNENMYEVANPQEIKEGSASLFTVIDGENLESFEIQIEKLNLRDNTKNIVFKVTDEKLLNKTGGIVQGMSGSPIVQNNKIIGAVTHVIVNDCTRGYGIFITNMLEESEN